jgi:hydrogenase maturation protease
MIVVAYGNTLRGDDGAAWAVAEMLIARRPDLVVHVVRSLAPELADDLATARIAVFVDARSGRCPGRIRIESIDCDGDVGASHGCSPAAIIASLDQLYGRRPAAFLVTIEGARFGFGEALSAEVEEAIPEAVAAIESLERYRRTTGPNRVSPPTVPCSRR